MCEQVGEKLDQLKKQHGEKLAMKESLRKKSEEMEVKLDRADKLVTGLAGERIRWEERVTVGHTHKYTRQNNYHSSARVRKFVILSQRQGKKAKTDYTIRNSESCARVAE